MAASSEDSSDREKRVTEAYCVKDKQKVQVRNAQRITMKNGHPAMVGTCPICGGKVFKIGSGVSALPEPAQNCQFCGRPPEMPHLAGCRGRA